MDTDIYYIAESAIHGKGVFAAQDLSANLKVFEYIGVEMVWKEFTEKYGPYKLNSLNTYPMRRIHRIIVAKEEPFKSQNIVNYINEGEPNCILKKKALWTIKEISTDFPVGAPGIISPSNPSISGKFSNILRDILYFFMNF